MPGSLLFRDFSGIGNYEVEEKLQRDQEVWLFCSNFVYKVVWVSETDNKTAPLMVQGKIKVSKHCLRKQKIFVFDWLSLISCHSNM